MCIPVNIPVQARSPAGLTATLAGTPIFGDDNSPDLHSDDIVIRLLGELLKNSPDAVTVFDLNGRVRAMNEVARALLLDEGDQPTDHHFCEFIVSDYCRAYIHCLSRNLMLGEAGAEPPMRPVLVRRPRGRAFPVNLRIAEIRLAEESLGVAYIRRISD